jgi:hypothetical protein
VAETVEDDVQLAEFDCVDLEVAKQLRLFAEYEFLGIKFKLFEVCIF